MRALHIALTEHLAGIPVLFDETVIPDLGEGVAILRTGNPGEPEEAIGVASWLWDHRAEVDVIVADSDGLSRMDRIDAIIEQINAAIAADITLGGVVYRADAEAPELISEAVEGAAALGGATVPIVLSYITTSSTG